MNLYIASPINDNAERTDRGFDIQIAYLVSHWHWQLIRIINNKVKYNFLHFNKFDKQVKLLHMVYLVH